jgi:hypothetical protein
MTRQYRIGNKCIRKKVGVAPRKYGHVKMICCEAQVRRVDQMKSSPISSGRGKINSISQRKDKNYKAIQI